VVLTGAAVLLLHRFGHVRQVPWSRVALGGMLVTGATLVALASAGALTWFLDAMLVFPFAGYASVGGVNDLALADDLQSRVRGIAEASHGLPVRLLALLALLTTLGSTIVGLLVPVVWALSARAKQRRLELLAALVWLVAVVVAVKPRPDTFHLVTFAVLPIALAPLPLAALGAEALLARGLTLLMAASVGVCGLSLVVNRALADDAPSILSGIDPELKLPEADARMVRSDSRLALLHEFARQRPQATMLASPVGAAGYFFGPAPATPYTLIYEPSVRYLRDADYQRIADAIERRPPDIVMFTTPEAEQSFLHPPEWRGEPCHRLARQLSGDYRVWRRLGSTVFLLKRTDPLLASQTDSTEPR
jgi:hypothetical protein